MSDLIFDAADTAEGDDENRIPYPVQGAEFELWAVRLPECDDPPTLLVDFMDRGLIAAMSDFGVGGNASFVDEDYFGSQASVIDAPGLWQLKVRVHYGHYSDWESGHTETILELQVLSAQRIT